jgi:hypothetical protein
MKFTQDKSHWIETGEGGTDAGHVRQTEYVGRLCR